MGPNSPAALAQALLGQSSAQPVADVYGQGGPEAGPYLPNLGWQNLSRSDQDSTKNIFSSHDLLNLGGEDFTTRDDIEKLMKQHGIIQLYPYGNPAAEEFLRTAPPGTQRYNYLDDDKGIHTTFLKSPLTS